MRECICSNCKNLKAVIDGEGKVSSYECVYGYPSESCASCETGECELECIHYVKDEENPVVVTVKCDSCGKDLQQACGNDEEGRILCIDCFLKGM